MDVALRQKIQKRVREPRGPTMESGYGLVYGSNLSASARENVP